MAILRAPALGHAGASSGERAAWKISRNVTNGRSVDYSDCFSRLDGAQKREGTVLLLEVARARIGWVTFAESKAFPLVGPIVSRPSR